jgi:purine-binding chemotaxis protein CheW
LTPTGFSVSAIDKISVLPMLHKSSSDLYVIAIAAGQRIALKAASVASVVDLGEIVPIPLASRHILGVCALRSQVLTVIDLAGALGQSPETVSRRAVVMQIAGHHYALVVARVDQVEPSSGGVQPIDASIGPDWAKAALGRIQTESGTALLLDPMQLVGSGADVTL